MSKVEQISKKYDPSKIEPEVYSIWEESGLFSPEGSYKLRDKVGLTNKEETFCVLMPPPNANAPLHCGHVTYAIQDLYTRLHRMKGYKSLYLPGTDHAGFETQVVYERKLKEEGKSRFDFDRQTLYEDILNFVKENSQVATDQLKKIGMSADWNRNVFMLADEVVDIVLETFQKMHNDGLVYRDMYMVNYSPHHGTTFSNLETEYIENISPLYYVGYKIKGSEDKITIATVRPETIFADVAVAINPEDSRYKKYAGKSVINPLTKEEMPIIEDDYVDIEFGTGALKITPAHDFSDFEIGKKHNLSMPSVINLEGNMINTGSKIDGMSVDAAREVSVDMLKSLGALEKVDNKYKNRIAVDYKDKLPIEPMLLPNWFVKTEGLAKRAIKVVEDEEIKFYSKSWKKEILRWLEDIRDWPISRQIVFGIRMPVWYSVEDNPNIFVVFLDKDGNSVDGRLKDLLDSYDYEEISSGLQKLIAPKDSKYVLSKDNPGKGYLQETDTFDTWFSSGQWPLTTLGFSHEGNHNEDFEEFFPTSLMDSMWDILFFWLARMIMFSLYLTDKVPFEEVYIHGMITDENNQKMSKSKGNVIDPLELVEKYGADALRMGIMVGGNTSAREIALSEDKIRGYRNFANKIWNMARFILIMEDKVIKDEGKEIWREFDKKRPDFLAVSDYLESKELKNVLNEKFSLVKEDLEILEDLDKLIKSVEGSLEKYRIKDAGDEIYHFIWDRIASDYLEFVKEREDKQTALTVLFAVFESSLKLLHPFMPFVTEGIWNKII